MPEFLQLLHPSVAKLKPYLPGKSIQEIEQKYGLKHVIKLASNENPWGCSPKVISKLRQITAEDISIYPNTYLHPFVNNLQKMLSVPADSIFIANGSDAIFSLLIQAFALAQQKSILSHQYAFMGYRTQAQSFGLECVEVAVNPRTWTLDMADLSQAVKPQTAIIFLANPNNPTGVLIPWTQICQLLDQIPKQTLVVIDEAYEEYINHDHPALTALLARYPNLIITRTLSKAYGLASLRLGYAIAHPEIVNILKTIQLPFSVNQVALNCGNIAIQDPIFIQKTKIHTLAEKQKLIQALSQFPFRLHPTEGNFLTIDCNENSENLVKFLESQGIIVRPLHAFGLEKCIRITIGQEHQNLILIRQLKNYYRT